MLISIVFKFMEIHCWYTTYFFLQEQQNYVVALGKALRNPNIEHIEA